MSPFHLKMHCKIILMWPRNVCSFHSWPLKNISVPTAHLLVSCPLLYHTHSVLYLCQMLFFCPHLEIIKIVFVLHLHTCSALGAILQLGTCCSTCQLQLRYSFPGEALSESGASPPSFLLLLWPDPLPPCFLASLFLTCIQNIAQVMQSLSYLVSVDLESP